jgi:hypothetical protein
MDSRDLIEKTGGKGVRGMAGGADDLVSKSAAGKTGVPADKKNIGPMAAAAVAVALNIEFTSAGNGPPEADSTVGNIVCF